MMTDTAVPNAADILPKRLLSKLQRYCSGLIYVPGPQTQAQMNISRVRSLHNGIRKPSEIAEVVGISAQHVRDIIRELECGISNSRKYKIYEVVPQEIVDAVQRYVSGPVYVPGRVSKADRRWSTVQRLLRRGIPVSGVAKRSGLSERRVRQIRQAEPDIGIKPKKEKPQDRFDIDAVVDPDYTPPKRCCVCGMPVDPGEDQCDVCRYKAETMRGADSDVVTIHDIPFAIIDRRF